VCYVIPVALHLKIYFSPGGYRSLQEQPQQQLLAQGSQDLQAPLLQVTAASWSC
jgi:hypothetical protein